MAMKTYDFNPRVFHYDRFGKRGLDPRPQAKAPRPKIVASRSVGSVVLAYNYGVFGDNTPVLWVKHLGEGKE